MASEASRIPLNLGTSASKISKAFAQADEWVGTHHPLLVRCGVESSYVPPGVAAPAGVPGPLRLEEITEALSEADSDIPYDLDVVVGLRKVEERAQDWLEQAAEVAPKDGEEDKGGSSSGDEKHSMEELSDLIDESSSTLVDVSEDLDRLRLVQSGTAAWRMQAQQSLRAIASAFGDFREERAKICFGGAPTAKSPSAMELDQPSAIHHAQVATSAAASSAVHQDHAGPGPLNGETSPPASSPGEPEGGADAAESPTSTRHVNLRRKPSNTDSPSARASGGDTPAENGGGVLFQLVADFVKSEKSTRISMPEGDLAGELNDVTLWFARAFKALASPSDIYDKKNAGRFNKLIQGGERLAGLDRVKSLDIDEDATLVDSLRGVYSCAVDDEVKRLLVLQEKRDKFLRWSERADAAMSKDKVPVETLVELNAESGAFPPCKSASLNSCLCFLPRLTIVLSCLVLSPPPPPPPPRNLGGCTQA